MRILIISLIVLFIIPRDVVGQKKDKMWSELIAKNVSLDIQIIKKGNSKKIDYYVFFNSDSDSLSFRFLNGSFKEHAKNYIETCKVIAVQLDKIGRKEIVVELISSSSSTKSISTYIFNLDTKQRIFHGQNLWNSRFEGDRIANCLGYQYSISFDYKRNLIIEYPNTHSCMIPDKKEGVYSLLNGIFYFVE